MKRLWQWLHKWWTLTACVGVTLWNCSCILWDARWHKLKRGTVNRRLQIGSKHILSLIDANYRIEFAPGFQMQNKVPIIFMANHLSFFDLPLLYALLPGTTRFLVKQYLFHLPIFGPAIQEAEFLAVDAQNPQSMDQLFQSAKEKLAQGIRLFIFPEGKRSSTGQLSPLKPGGFRFAREVGAQIIPIGIDGTDRALPPFTWNLRRHQSLTVRVGMPIDTTAFNGIDGQKTLMQTVAQSISRLAAGCTSNHPGPAFSRKDLEIVSSGKISSRFGDWFKPLDQYARVIRMPQPPLLLTDRILGIDAEPGSLANKGVIWSETDVCEDSWYLHQGHMPFGISIESGQAILLLTSWLGLDFYNRGERVYRLLGSEFQYLGGLPKIGDTLHYEVHLEGHAKQGDIRIVFFRCECRINGELRIKGTGQAGFFSDQELAESGGILWDVNNESCDTSLPLAPPKIQAPFTPINRQQLEAFAQGDVVTCFGQAYNRTQTHTRTPCIASGRMLFLHDITHFDPHGGPWQRGYMRGVQTVTPDDWFFKAHFKNSPCMPATLMLETGLQLMACYMTALGYTVNRDGWRFEPVTEQTYKLRCRGQVQPDTQQAIYEIFVTSVIAEPIPTLYADLLITVDGLKSFHGKVGLRLTPDWPLTDKHPLLQNHSDNPPAASIDGFTFDFRSLLAGALGKPSQLFGKLYQPFDNHRRIPRIPAPPYHFMSRVTDIQAQMGKMASGGEVTFAYDVPDDAWYFSKNGYATMPFCVYLESLLQPCGWTAFFMGCALHSEQDLLFRNLDGSLTWHQEVLPTAGQLRTHVKVTQVSQSAGMIICAFQVQGYIKDAPICTMNTVFGFFPPEAFIDQVGLPIPEHEKSLLSLADSTLVDLTQTPASDSHDLGTWAVHPPKNSFPVDESLAPLAGLHQPTLLMIDRVTGFWRNQGGYRAQLVGEKTLDPSLWFFKAHFFNDPVQPGSLGLEAMLQLLQFYMLSENLHADMVNPRFQPLAVNTTLTWKYRGQVVSENKRMTVMIHVISVQKDEEGILALAEGSLWVDGKRIYEAQNLGMRLVAQ